MLEVTEEMIAIVRIISLKTGDTERYLFGVFCCFFFFFV